MRIALVTPEFPPAEAMGGIGTNTAVLARGLSDLGHEVIVVTRGGGRRTWRHDIEVVGVAQPRVPSRLPGKRALTHLVGRALIAHAVRSAHVDVVHAAEWQAEAWLVARLRMAPVVTRLATPTHVVEELNEGGLRPDRVIRWMERDQARRSTRVYGPTTAVIDRVARDWELDASRIARIPNSIDSAFVRGSAESATATAAGLVPAGGIVFIGRLERRKGVEVLGEALPPVLREFGDAHAVLIGRDAGSGGGSAVEALRARLGEVAPRVHLVGELPRDVALAIVAGARVVALPSLWESFGYVCVEAMALSRPVVATDVGGFSEIVTHDVDGVLVPPGDAPALAAAIRGVLADEQRAASLGAEAQRRSRDYDVGTIAPRVARLLSDVANADPAADVIAPEIHRGGYFKHFRPDERRDPFYDLYQRKRDAVVSALSDEQGLRVLDAGGGYGRISSRLSDRHDVVLCDLSSEMLGGARQAGVAQLVQSDAARLPFPDGSFDVLIALDLLVHLPDTDAGVRELVRVVRPGGRVLIDSTNSNPWWVLAYPGYVNWRPRRLLRTMRSGGVLPEWRAVVRHHRAAEVRQSLEAAGIRVDDMTPFGPRWTPKWQLWHGVRV